VTQFLVNTDANFAADADMWTVVEILERSEWADSSRETEADVED